MEVTEENKHYVPMNRPIYPTFYYDDGPNKGFNHLELRRFKRLYTEGNAKKGDEAQPMRETKDWLEKEVFRND